MSPYDEKPKSERIIDDLKLRQQEKKIVDVDEKLIKIVIFSIASKRYAFYGSSVKEILPAGNISWIPSLPDFLPGLITIRGDIESVVDIRCFLGEKSSAVSCRYIALVVTDSFRTGILVDSIDDVTDISLSAIKPPITTLSGAARELVCGEIEWCNETVALLDIAKIESRITL
jgi:purine-binding chemotaxis protein CheW